MGEILKELIKHSGTLMDNLKAFATGFVVGGIFALLKLDVPAPLFLPGIVGILGMFVGYIVISAILKPRG